MDSYCSLQVATWNINHGPTITSQFLNEDFLSWLHVLYLSLGGIEPKPLENCYLQSMDAYFQLQVTMWNKLWLKYVRCIQTIF
jgi:hypothetical protein